MKQISKLSDQELLIKIKSLAGDEKRITQEVLNHLEEVEYRKLYLEKGYSSLLDFCVVELKYSESSAQRRISAMWLIRKIPEAKEKLQSGQVNLSTLTQLNGFLRREEKTKTYSKEMKLDLLGKIEGKSQDECEREFIKISPQEVSFKEKKRPITEDLTQITFIASKELMNKLSEIRNLIAHRNSNPTTSELVEILADMALKKLASATQSKTVAAKQCVKNVEEIISHEIKNWPTSRHIPNIIREYVWKRDEGQCQYVNKENNKKCQSKFALQIDHIHPFYLGGTHNKENLRLLCRAHNNWRTKELFNSSDWELHHN